MITNSTSRVDSSVVDFLTLFSVIESIFKKKPLSISDICNKWTDLISDRAVKTSVKRLLEKKVIIVIEGGQGRKFRYQINPNLCIEHFSHIKVSKSSKRRWYQKCEMVGFLKYHDGKRVINPQGVLEHLRKHGGDVSEFLNGLRLIVSVFSQVKIDNLDEDTFIRVLDNLDFTFDDQLWSMDGISKEVVQKFLCLIAEQQ